MSCHCEQVVANLMTKNESHWPLCLGHYVKSYCVVGNRCYLSCVRPYLSMSFIITVITERTYWQLWSSHGHLLPTCSIPRTKTKVERLKKTEGGREDKQNWLETKKGSQLHWELEVASERVCSLPLLAVFHIVKFTLTSMPTSQVKGGGQRGEHWKIGWRVDNRKYSDGNVELIERDGDRWTADRKAPTERHDSLSASLLSVCVIMKPAPAVHLQSLPDVKPTAVSTV